MHSKIAAIAAFIAGATAQQACTSTPERHPPLRWSRCAAGGTCSNVAGSVVLDSNWRWTHRVQDSTNCYTGNKWDTTICPDGKTCASSCCVDGADYQGTYGITTTDDALRLQFVTTHTHGKSIGSRVYLMEAGNDNAYQTFNLLNNEFTFDVDVSQLVCGLNGALYFVSMDKDGGQSKQPLNKAGPKYGAGYCDSQCPRDLKFINGEANVVGWNGSPDNPNGGVGQAGACCAEMDIWEANSISNAYTPHPCDTNTYHTCSGDSCGGTYSADRYGGTCDPDGCDFNPFRQGNETFYGPGPQFTVDTTKKITVVTQFLTNSAGELSEIRRVYVQNGKVIANSQSDGPPGDSITQNWCDAQKLLFGDIDVHKKHGGLKQMGEAAKSMVLVLSLWDDYYSNMLWLDSTLGDGSKPGERRGTCSTDSGKPEEIERDHPNATVIFSNIKFGPIGSTYNSGPQQPPPSSSSIVTRTTTSTRASTSTSSTRISSSTSSSRAPTPSGAPVWGQCGGQGWGGPTTCVAGGCCRAQNQWYSQCLPC